MNRNLLKLYLFIISISLNACFFSRQVSQHDSRRINKLTQIAVFKYLDSPWVSFINTDGQGLIKLDPLLCIRDTLSMDGRVHFNQPLEFPEFKFPVPSSSYWLVIPDSLSYKYRYTDTLNNYKFDYANIYQFSQLVPSIKPNIYYMQNRVWVNNCGDMIDERDTLCIRSLFCFVLKFSVKKNNVTFIETIEDGDEYHSVRSFSRRELEKK